MEKILITGGSGLIGKNLSSYLSSQNYEVRLLSRKKDLNNSSVYFWDLESGYIDEEALAGIDHIIHLAGAGIAEKRWTAKRKNEIIDSRVKSAELLFSEANKMYIKPKTFISASAVGYYGAVTTEKIFTETDDPGNDFQGKVCQQWESSSQKFSELGIRNVQLRFGVVLSAKGGALPKMMLPIKLWIGSALGTGNQFVPWVHIDDVVRIIEKAILDEDMSGPYNLVAPEYKTNKELVEAIAWKMGKPLFMPNVPRFLLKIILGEMSQLVLEGSRISSKKILGSAYTFSYPILDKALSDLLSTDK